jgi:hypothetical protein
VVLLRGGRSATVKFYELSTSDQDYLRELLASRGQEALIPPKVDETVGEQANIGTSPAAGQLPPGAPSNVAGSAPGGPRFPRGVGIPPAAGIPPSVSGPAIPPSPFPTGPVASIPPMPMPVPGGFFPGSTPPASSFPGSPPGSFGPGSYGPSSTPPGMGPANTYPPGPSFPSAGPPSMPRSGAGLGGSSFERMNEQLERSRQQQRESLEQMQRDMSAQHESLINRHRATGECLSCKHTLNESEMKGRSCPYCGVTWDYEIDEFGNKRSINNSGMQNPFARGNVGGNNPAIDRNTARTIGLVIGGMIGLAVVLGMIIGTIYILMSIASASSSSQQRYYR